MHMWTITDFTKMWIVKVQGTKYLWSSIHICLYSWLHPMCHLPVFFMASRCCTKDIHTVVVILVVVWWSCFIYGRNYICWYNGKTYWCCVISLAASSFTYMSDCPLYSLRLNLSWSWWILFHKMYICATTMWLGMCGNVIGGSCGLLELFPMSI